MEIQGTLFNRQATILYMITFWWYDFREAKTTTLSNTSFHASVHLDHSNKLFPSQHIITAFYIPELIVLMFFLMCFNVGQNAPSFLQCTVNSPCNDTQGTLKIVSLHPGIVTSG